LHYFFCDGVVGRRLWLTRFPDVMPDDCLLWGFLKEGVYKNRPSLRGLEDLNNIWLLMALTNTPFEKLQDRRAKRQCMSSRKLGDFSASAVITYFLTHSWYFWRKYK
jgi:hypothetical protein